VASPPTMRRSSTTRCPQPRSLRPPSSGPRPTCCLGLLCVGVFLKPTDDFGLKLDIGPDIPICAPAGDDDAPPPPALPSRGSRPQPRPVTTQPMSRPAPATPPSPRGRSTATCT
jgi:hypothetical protein